MNRPAPRDRKAKGSAEAGRFAVRALILAALLRASAASAIDHSGTCTGTFAAADNPHRLTGNCTVPAGQTLTIQPGVILISQTGSNFSLIINGTLDAAGAVGNVITSTNVFWQFTAESTGTLTNCTLTGPSSTPITSTDASPTVMSCALSGASTGISVGGSSQVAPAQPTISGNAITVSSQGIAVSGTARPSLMANSIITNSVGISYSGSAAGTASANIINFVAEGGSSRTGIRVSATAAPTLNGNTINDDGARTDTAIGLDINPGVAVQVTNNTIHVTGTDKALDLDPDVFASGPTISGNLFPEGLAGGMGVSGTLTGAVTLKAIEGQSTFGLTGTLSVASGATLTVPAGFEIRGAHNAMDVRAGGTLLAAGTSAAQRDVRFIDVFVQFDGPSGSTPASGGSLTNCTLTGPSGSTAIFITDASPTVTSCALSGASTGISVGGSSQVAPAQPTISGNAITVSSQGIAVSGTARPMISDCVIGPASSGVSLSGTSRTSLSNNRFMLNTRAIDVNGGGALSVTDQNVLDRNTFSLSVDGAAALFSAFPTAFDTNEFLGSPEQNLIELPNSMAVATSGTIRAAKVAYRPTGLTINAGSTVLVEPCTVFKNSNSSSFLVNGNAILGGRPDCPIVFSSQTPKDGTRWRGLQLNNQLSSSPTFLDSVVVEFAGAGNDPGLRLNNSSINVSNTTVTGATATGMEITNSSMPQVTGAIIGFNGTDGVRISSGARPRFMRSSIVGNAGFGMRSEDCPVVRNIISAENLYWGDDAGPLDSSNDTALSGGLFNPNGLGSRVSDCIDYDPWVVWRRRSRARSRQSWAAGRAARREACFRPRSASRCAAR